MIKLRNHDNGFGIVAILLHWLTALVIIGLFFLGLWMMGLDYYSPWYNKGPEWHKLVGLLLLPLMLLRLVWRWSNPLPVSSDDSRIVQMIARSVHRLMYLLIFIIIASGYLIISADGKPIALFELPALPPVSTGMTQQEELSGMWHLYLSYALMALVSLHTLAALKHHFYNRDNTLKNMLTGGKP